MIIKNILRGIRQLNRYANKLLFHTQNLTPARNKIIQDGNSVIDWQKKY